MRRVFLRFWLASKRLLKKPLYLAILLLLPVLALCFGMTAQSDSGMVRIALAVRDSDDPMASQVVERLTSGTGMIRFMHTSPEEAQALVAAGKADAAWILPEDMEQRILTFLEDPGQPVVRVLQREETVLLRLSRETLSGALYECCAQPLYLRYIRQNAPQLSGLSDEDLTAYLALFEGNDRLFAFETAEGKEATEENYLLSPLRGLLGILILLCALAAAMYFAGDCKAGVYDTIPAAALPGAEFGGQLAALWPVSAATLLALAACGLWTGWREFAVAVLYALCCAAFAMLLRRICGKVQVLAGLLPVLTAAMLVLCPVFFTLPGLEAAQYLFPPTYYIQAVSSDKFLLLLPVYTGLCFLGCMPFGRER